MGLLDCGRLATLAPKWALLRRPTRARVLRRAEALLAGDEQRAIVAL